MNKLNEYNKKKELFLNKSNELNEILKKHNVKSLELEDIQKRLRENEFSIIVVGEFSSGKSTFINSLLKRDILPSKVLPTTAIITVIEDGKEGVLVKYKDSKEKTLNLEEIQKFATALDEDGAKEATKIEKMIVKVKNNYTKEGVTIVDTPGVEDLDQSREEITYSMIPESDAAIVILDARRALKSSEVKFLKEHILNTSINKLFFILNFTDTIKKLSEVIDEETGEKKTKRVFDKQELNKIIDETTEKLKDVVGANDVKLYALSAKQGLKEYNEKLPGQFTEMFEIFEQRLQNFLVEEKGDILLKNSMSRMNNVLKEIRRILDFKVQAINKPLEEIKEKEQELLNLIVKIESESGIVTSQLRETFYSISKTVAPKVKSIVNNNITRMTDSTSIQSDLEIAEYEKIINKMINDDIDKYFEHTIKVEIGKCVLNTEKKIEYLIENINDFLDFNLEKTKNISNVLGNSSYINYSQEDIETTIKKGAIVSLVPSLSTFLLLSVFSVSFGVAVIIGGIITGILATFGLDKVFSTNKKSKFTDAIRKNSDKIANSIIGNIETTITELAEEYSKEINKALNLKINSSKESLKTVIKEKEQEVVYQEESLKKLAKENLRINNIEKELCEISNLNEEI